jgi:energy-coupling factor transporter ATP-binding protein EcfA2
MIEKASFRNFKSLRQVDVDLEPLTVIVGPNASGKTSILEGLHLVLQAMPMTKDPGKLLIGVRHPRFLYSRGVQAEDMEICCLHANTGICLKVGFPLSSPTELPHPAPDRDDLIGWHPQFEFRINQEADPDGGWKPVPTSTAIRQHFGSSSLLRFSAPILAGPSYSGSSRPRIETDGTGMASALAFMALNQPDRFEQLQGHLRSIIPTVRRIRFDRVPVHRLETETVTIDGQGLTRRLDKEFMGDEVVIDFQGAPDVPGTHVSEGTLLILGLLTVILDPACPKLLLLDDLDHGLHPKAQRKLIPVIRALMAENPDIQIIATTHSPYILDELDPGEVRITWASEDGITSCARLDQHPDLDRWKEELWPGEFWSLVGEQWVANGLGREGH